MDNASVRYYRSDDLPLGCWEVLGTDREGVTREDGWGFSGRAGRGDFTFDNLGCQLRDRGLLTTRLDMVRGLLGCMDARYRAERHDEPLFGSDGGRPPSDVEPQTRRESREPLASQYNAPINNP